MRNTLKYILCLAVALVGIGIQGVKAQLVVDNNYSPTQLVEDVLLGGGVVASNISYTGSVQARGYFDGQNCNVGLGEGILLSTGPTFNALGPNNDGGGGASNNDFGLPGDAALDAISGNQTFDAVVLEFDFIPFSDSLSFRYVFASEEYMEFVNSFVNDAFGFFISGPGIPGEQNIALIPNTSIPVTIDDLNQNSFGQYYNNNGDGFQAPFNGSNNYIQYDGFTDVLEARAIVVPCETYHIRLVIADGGDGIYDSGVFLEAGSFNAGTISLSSEATFSTSINDTALVEGCGQATVNFERSGSLSNPTTIHFTISGSADNGVDYDLIADSVNLAAGQAVGSVVLTPIFDGLPEGTETFTVTASIGNPCLGSTETSLTLTISDPPALSVSAFGDTSLVCPSQVSLSALASGGLGYYHYSWSHGAGNGPNVTPLVDSTTTYVVTVTDTCGTQAAQATVQVDLPAYDPLEVSVNDAEVCGGSPAVLVAKPTGGAAPFLFEWEDNLGFSDSVIVAPFVTTLYTVTVTDSCGASQSASGTVSTLSAFADFEWEYAGNHAMNFFNTSPDAISTLWDFGDGTFTDIENPYHDYGDSGTFVVVLTIESSNGCIDTVAKPIIAYPDFHAYIPNAFTPGTNNINDFFLAKGEGFVSFKMDIYDRWGGHQFHTESHRKSWRGLNKNGTIMPPGVYLYIYEFTTPLGQVIKRYGHVTLLR